MSDIEIIHAALQVARSTYWNMPNERLFVDALAALDRLSDLDKKTNQIIKKPWLLKLICCGRDDGEEQFATWEEADRFREASTSGEGIAEHGYSAQADEPGHRRAAILYRLSAPLSERARELAKQVVMAGSLSTDAGVSYPGAALIESSWARVRQECADAVRNMDVAELKLSPKESRGFMVARDLALDAILAQPKEKP